MQQWEYLFLSVEGDQGPLWKEKNVVVWTSDGRWKNEKLPKAQTPITGILNQLGAEGWEMVNCGGLSGSNSYVQVLPSGDFQAVFKRPKS